MEAKVHGGGAAADERRQSDIVQIADVVMWLREQRP